MPTETENGWLSYLSPRTLWNPSSNATSSQEPTKDINRHRTLTISKSVGHTATANPNSLSLLYAKRSISMREGERVRRMDDGKSLNVPIESESATKTTRRRLSFYLKVLILYYHGFTVLQNFLQEYLHFITITNIVMSRSFIHDIIDSTRVISVSTRVTAKQTYNILK